MELNKTYNSQKISRGKRLLSMFLDQNFMSMIAALFWVPLLIESMANSMQVSHENKPFYDLNSPFFYFSFIGFALFFCKDSIGGKSIAKRILNFQIIEVKSGQIASPLRCLVRNLFTAIWPIEVIFCLINPSRRLGDFVAGTRLINTEKSNASFKPKYAGILLSFIISYGLFLILIIPFQNLLSNSEQKIYLESSYNSQASKLLTNQLNDSLKSYLTSDVKIYDKTTHRDLKYISVIFRLKENYLEEEEDNIRLKKLCLKQIYLKYSEIEFTGQVQYVYETEGFFKSHSETIGTDIYKNIK